MAATRTEAERVRGARPAQDDDPHTAVGFAAALGFSPDQSRSQLPVGDRNCSTEKAGDGKHHAAFRRQKEAGRVLR